MHIYLLLFFANNVYSQNKILIYFTFLNLYIFNLHYFLTLKKILQFIFQYNKEKIVFKHSGNLHLICVNTITLFRYNLL